MITAEVLAPSRLGSPELQVWSQMMAAAPHLRRAFLSPGFARACEIAHGRAYVAVLHEAGTIRGFLPFQFRTAWHQHVRLAERIGGALCDNAGLIAASGFAIDPAVLLRRCGLGGLFLTHLAAEQTAFGLASTTWEIGHRIDLEAGGAGYFQRLRGDRRSFVQDTERRLRRAERDYGELDFSFTARPGRQAIDQLIEAKRQQYERTQAADAFADPRRLRLVEILAETATEDCQPLLTSLTAGGHTLARHLGLLHAGVLSYWFPVYDPRANKISPGRLLLWHTIERCEALGIRLVDRGEGDSAAKRDFSTGTARYGLANYFARTPRAALARLCQAVEWRVERRRAPG